MAGGAGTLHGAKRPAEVGPEAVGNQTPISGQETMALTCAGHYVQFLTGATSFSDDNSLKTKNKT